VAAYDADGSGWRTDGGTLDGVLDSIAELWSAPE
jgi:hypothetical protein